MDADAIVIGAGAAGLAAARSLRARSLRVILIEARDRIGGRMYPHATGLSAMPAELGAEFIHGPAPTTLRVLAEAGTAAVDAGGESWTYRDGGLERDDDAAAFSGEIFAGSYGLAHDESVDRFLQRFEGREATAQARAARAFVEGFEAADPQIASARAIADEWRSGVDSTIGRPYGGYGPLIDRLRNACAAGGIQSYLSTAVRRISWRAGAVAVEATGAAGDVLTMRGRIAIVTLPIGVLRHSGDETAIRFDPPLPAGKRDALDRIEMGQVVKVTLSFRTAFWARDRDERYRDAGFFRREGQAFTAYWTQFPVRNTLVVAWAGGPQATALNGLSRTQLIGRALDGFASLFDEPATARDEFEGASMHDWDNDPFARGAYSYVAVGGDQARALLAAPLDDALFFAGEATCIDGQAGTVNGALESGERAAREAALTLGATRAQLAHDG